MTTLEQSKKTETGNEGQATGKSGRLGQTIVGLLVIVAAAIGILVYSGISSRTASAAALAEDTKANATLAVSVTHPKMSGADEEVVLPGNIQAFTDSPIYARTNGYLKKWYADIGTTVKAGQLLAEIDAPELDHQLQQARADFETAQANLKLAQSTADRWQFLLKTQSVSKQETDEKVGDLNAKKAMVDAAASAVHRLEDLQSYEKVTAPFDGVITARSTDVGALIDAGANSPGKELFHLAATDRLRVFVNVPEIYGRSAQSGARAKLTLAEYPGRNFSGIIARNSNAIDTASRTLLVEVDVDNPSGELLPGAYVSVHVKVQGNGRRALTIPVNTMLFRQEGLRVAVVREGKAQLVPVTIGRDFGNEAEVVAGLRPQDQVILDPADSLVSGEPVKISAGGAD
jgi:RND family efflux transporter MFP subunit